MRIKYFVYQMLKRRKYCHVRLYRINKEMTLTIFEDVMNRYLVCSLF